MRRHPIFGYILMRTDNFMLHEDTIRPLLKALKPVRYTSNTVEPLLLGRELKLVTIYDAEMPRDKAVVRDE